MIGKRGKVEKGGKGWEETYMIAEAWPNFSTATSHSLKTRALRPNSSNLGTSATVPVNSMESRNSPSLKVLSSSSSSSSSCSIFLTTLEMGSWDSAFFEGEIETSDLVKPNKHEADKDEREKKDSQLDVSTWGMKVINRMDGDCIIGKEFFDPFEVKGIKVWKLRTERRNSKIEMVKCSLDS